MTIKDAGGTSVTQFSTHLNICFRYSQPELDAVGGDPANFIIQTFHQGTWQTLPTTPESNPNASVLGQVCAPVNHLTLFALFVDNSVNLTENGQPNTPQEIVSLQAEQTLSGDDPVLPIKYLPEAGAQPPVILWSTYITTGPHIRAPTCIAVVACVGIIVAAGVSILTLHKANPAST